MKVILEKLLVFFFLLFYLSQKLFTNDLQFLYFLLHFAKLQLANGRIALTSQRHNHWLLILFEITNVEIITIFQVHNLLDNGLFTNGELSILDILLFIVNIIV